jgi:hypothetical protein
VLKAIAYIKDMIIMTVLCYGNVEIKEQFEILREVIEEKKQ